MPLDIATAYGTVSTFAGSTAGFTDGAASVALLHDPLGIALNPFGGVYVADAFNNAVRDVNDEGAVATITGNGVAGNQDGTIASATFYSPSGIAATADGIMYIADRGNNMIRKIDASGTVSTFAGTGSAGYTDGAGTKAEFNTPTGLAVDAAGNVYVADMGNNLIRKITPDGTVSTVAGKRTNGYVNATGTDAVFKKPTGIAVTSSGTLYVADQGNYAIRKITVDGTVSTVCGGPNSSSLLGNPFAIAIDTNGTLLISDVTGRILRLDAGNILKVVAGGYGVYDFADGYGATARFNAPGGIALDNLGNVYVADQNNHRIRLITFGQQ